ncbi:3-carboxymuconate cyclase [Trichoderma guizhouense]|uniref:3-carboxymuconate cyclase n=1 Tax=Trichoderma guizhouense TaxID=1491466 RepID=A0A1T3CLB7_9HYPO|nr:3-carboxymuconate cyclase [Trichoderma guizhouense]
MLLFSLATCWLTLSLASSLPDSESKRDTNAVPRAAYFLDNDPSGASIVALDILSNGTLSSPVRTLTGGKGSWAKWIIPSPAPPDNTGFAGPDSLFSANSIVVSGNFLFAVNAGSNTLSLFKIDPSNPQHLTLVGKPVGTLGDFPISVTYSEKLHMACVLNGGTRAGVACFSVDASRGLVVLDGSLRSITKAFNQTTPPGGPILTASDIMFNPSSTGLFVSTKGAPPSSAGASPTLGFIYAWPVVGKTVSTTATISQPSGIILDFSLTFLGADDSILLTDAAGVGYILSVSSGLQVTVKDKVVLPSNEGLACWGVYVPELSSAYVITASITNITVVDPSTGSVTGTITLPASDVGVFDTAYDRTFLYSLTNVASIAVVDLAANPPKMIQNLDLSNTGARKGWQGIAIYPSA